MVNGTSRSRTSSKVNGKTKTSKKSNKLVMRLSQIMFVSFFGVAGITGLNFKKSVHLQIDATQKQIMTSAATVDQLLKEEGIEKNNYKVITNDNNVDADETIVLSAKKNITLTLSGVTKTVETHALTVDEFLKEQNISLSETVVLDKASDYQMENFLVNYQTFKVDSITKEIKETTSAADLPEQVVETDDLFKGQVEETKGEPRIVVTKVEIQKVNGVEKQQVKLSETVVKEGKPTVKKHGKKALAPGLTEDKKKLMATAGISAEDYEFVNYIITKESNWNIGATNSSSGAYGLPQSLPGSKMASAGSDWQTNPVTQLKWADGYAKSRYGSWKQAYEYWMAHHVW